MTMEKDDQLDAQWVENACGLDLREVTQNLMVGVSIQEQLNISDEMLDRFYRIASTYLDEKRYAKAADCFLAIAMLNPFVSEFWLRLGNAEVGNQQHKNALEAYSMAMLYDADDPYPHLYSAQVYAHQDKRQKAKQCVEVCLRLVDEDPSMEPVRPLAMGLKQRLEDTR